MKFTPTRARVPALLVSVLILAACSSPTAEPSGEPSAEPTAVTPSPSTSASPTAAPSPSEDLNSITLSSPDLDDAGYLPDWAINNVSGYCTGTENRSPQLDWTEPPAGTVEFVLIMNDPTYNYVHWVVTDIGPEVRSIPQAADGAISIGTVGTNWQGPGIYAGVCIPNNTYEYLLYAIDTDIDGQASTTMAGALALIEGHVLAEAELRVKGH